MTVVTDRQTRSVSGTVYADGRPRIVDIKGIRIDAEFAPSMLYVTNQDKPGFVGRFATLLAEAGINIATFHLGREAEGGNAIALVEVDGAVPTEVLWTRRSAHRIQEWVADSTGPLTLPTTSPPAIARIPSSSTTGAPMPI